MKLKRKNKKDIVEKMCMIQKQFGDAVIFKIGIKDNGKTIDIISADNTFSEKAIKIKENAEELELRLPEVPDYVG